MNKWQYCYTIKIVAIQTQMVGRQSKMQGPTLSDYVPSEIEIPSALENKASPTTASTAVKPDIQTVDFDDDDILL